MGAQAQQFKENLVAFRIIQNSQLNETELENLKALARICEENDGCIPHMYWDIIAEVREHPSNFFCYDNETLIGYLNVFYFDAGQADICAMVHPNYRRQKIFSHLFQTALECIKKFNIHKTVFSFPQKNEMAKDCVKSLGGKFLHEEYHMQRNHMRREIITQNNLALKRAGSSDIELIAQIDNACFSIGYFMILHRLRRIINDPNRKVWLAYLEDICIGKTHVLFDKNGAYIHNVCILPHYQKNGYGTILLQSVINHLIDENHFQMHLDVIAQQNSALNIYKKCGFEITKIYEYWEYEAP